MRFTAHPRLNWSGFQDTRLTFLGDERDISGVVFDSRSAQQPLMLSYQLYRPKFCHAGLPTLFWGKGTDLHFMVVRQTLELRKIQIY